MLLFYYYYNYYKLLFFPSAWWNTAVGQHPNFQPGSVTSGPVWSCWSLCRQTWVFDTVFRVLFWIHDSFLYNQKMIEVQASYGLVLSLVILAFLGLLVFLVHGLLFDIIRFLLCLCLAFVFQSSASPVKFSLVSMFIYPSISCLCVCLSPSAQSCFCLVCVLSTCLCFLSCLVSSFVSPVCHVSVYPQSQCLVHMSQSGSQCVLLPVLFVPMSLFVLMSVSLFSFSSSVFPGVFNLPNYLVSLSVQCHIVVIHPFMLCALFLHFSLVSM